MTILIGMLCQDGVVVGADSSATFGAGQVKTIEQKVEKINIIEDRVIVTGTGQVGLGQRFNDVVEEYWKCKGFQKPYIQIGRDLSGAGIKDFGSTGMRPGQFGALVAFPQGDSFHLCEFATNDFQPEWKTVDMWYVSMGGGQIIADSFLGLMRRVFWGDKSPNWQDGVFYVAWALHHTIEVNPGGIKDPIKITVLHKDKKGKAHSRFITDEELEAHKENINGVEEHLATYKKTLQGEKQEGDAEIPAIDEKIAKPKKMVSKANMVENFPIDLN